MRLSSVLVWCLLAGLFGAGFLLGSLLCSCSSPLDQFASLSSSSSSSSECLARATRMEAHLLEAQREYRRCVLSHPPARRPAVRAGRSPDEEEENKPEQDVQEQSKPEDKATRTRTSRRAALLLRLDACRLVPRAEDAVDAVIVWINGSDPLWQYARHEHHHHQEQQHKEMALHDNGGLRATLRALAKYGSELNIGTIHIVTVFGQRPDWLLEEARLSMPGVPELRLVDLSKHEASIDSVPKLLRHIDVIPNLRNDFLLWTDRCILGKPVHRSDFWATDDGWGPRLHLDSVVIRNHGDTDCVLDRILGLPKCGEGRRVTVASYRPFAFSLCALQLLLQEKHVQQALSFDLPHLYAHWLLEHGLAGSVGEHNDDAQVVRIGYASPMELQDVLRKSYVHSMTCFDDQFHGSRIPMLEDFMMQRWSAKSVYEK